MIGHIRRRGEHSWELKFDIGTDPITGKRLTRYHSFKGTKRDAEAELIRLKAAADRGGYIEPSKTTLSEFLHRWKTWASTQVSPKTLERYRELLVQHVKPHLGAMRVQKLKTINFTDLYGRLQQPKPDGAGLAPRTVGHVHRLLHRALGYAVKWDIIATNPVSSAEPPRVERTEIEILTPEQATAVLHALRHTHASQLIAAGLDVVTVSRRIGHSNPTVALAVYAHLFGNTDERAAAALAKAE